LGSEANHHRRACLPRFRKAKAVQTNDYKRSHNSLTTRVVKPAEGHARAGPPIARRHGPGRQRRCGRCPWPGPIPAPAVPTESRRPDRTAAAAQPDAASPRRLSIAQAPTSAHAPPAHRSQRSPDCAGAGAGYTQPLSRRTTRRPVPSNEHRKHRSCERRRRPAADRARSRKHATSHHGALASPSSNVCTPFQPQYTRWQAIKPCASRSMTSTRST